MLTRSQSYKAHEENIRCEAVNFALLSQVDFEPSYFEDACINNV